MLVSLLIEEIKRKTSGVVASEQAVADAERDIGFAFPEQIKALYLGVANGGIGPGHHIIGVKGGHLSEENETISELYAALKEEDPFDPLWIWPDGLVPFCHWGNSIYSCFKASVQDSPVVWFDPNRREMGEPMEQQFIPHRDTLDSWLRGWLDGEDLWAELR